MSHNQSVTHVKKGEEGDRKGMPKGGKKAGGKGAAENYSIMEMEIKR